MLMDGDLVIRGADSVEDVVARSGHDPLFTWAAGARRERFGWVCAYTIGLLRTDLSQRDRLMVAGRPEAVAALANHVWAEHTRRCA